MKNGGRRRNPGVGRQAARAPRRGGFSLIEILVAVSILVVIVLMMSMVFHQSNVAWDSGTRKAEGNMTARAVLGFMARELSQAVSSSNILVNDIAHDSADITFVTLTGANSATQRVARRITYRLDEGTIMRQERSRKAGAGYGGSWSGRDVALADKVTTLKFYTSDGENHTTTLPDWIRIELGIERTDDVSGLGAWSKGPDNGRGGRPDDPADDIRSW